MFAGFAINNDKKKFILQDVKFTTKIYKKKKKVVFVNIDQRKRKEKKLSKILKLRLRAELQMPNHNAAQIITVASRSIQNHFSATRQKSILQLIILSCWPWWVFQQRSFLRQAVGWCHWLWRWRSSGRICINTELFRTGRFLFKYVWIGA